jgi:hypothetical protein
MQEKNPKEQVKLDTIKIRQGRNSAGRFTKYYHPLGCVCFITILNNKSDTGYYIITGVSKNGILNAIPMRTNPTQLHRKTFDVNDPKINIHIHFEYNSVDVEELITNINNGRLIDDNKNPAYHQVSISAVDELKMLKKILIQNEN